MASGSTILGKIGDRLKDRDKQTNFGTCKKCGKKVYWSSSKVASHVRSGHCLGATEEEVRRFKKEFVYDSPKNLVHRSAITKKFKENFEIEGISFRESPKKKHKMNEVSPEPVRAVIEEYENHEIIYEDQSDQYEDMDQSDQNNEEKLEIVFVPSNQDSEVKHTSFQPSSSGLSKEEKFIEAVYPQFKGKTKMELIDQILDLKRRNEMLLAKTKTYENTINRLLN